MRIVIADDDPVGRRVLEEAFARWDFAYHSCGNGREALTALLEEPRPTLAVLDWMMPEMDGVEVCRRVRGMEESEGIYLVLLTAHTGSANVVAGLDAGADDYIAKPFDLSELQARIRVGLRVLDLQTRLSQRVRELEEALGQVRNLEGLIPICAYCKRIRDDQDYWQQIEAYLASRSNARFSHGVCPDCFREVVQPMLDDLAREKEARDGSATPVPGART